MQGVATDRKRSKEEQRKEINTFFRAMYSMATYENRLVYTRRTCWENYKIINDKKQNVVNAAPIKLTCVKLVVQSLCAALQLIMCMWLTSIEKRENPIEICFECERPIEIVRCGFQTPVGTLMQIYIDRYLQTDPTYKCVSIHEIYFLCILLFVSS